MSFDEALRAKAEYLVKQAENAATDRARTAARIALKEGLESMTSHTPNLGFYADSLGDAMVKGDKAAIDAYRNNIITLVIKAMTNKVLSNA